MNIYSTKTKQSRVLHNPHIFTLLSHRVSSRSWSCGALPSLGNPNSNRFRSPYAHSLESLAQTRLVLLMSTALQSRGGLISLTQTSFAGTLGSDRKQFPVHNVHRNVLTIQSLLDMANGEVIMCWLQKDSHFARETVGFTTSPRNLPAHSESMAAASKLSAEQWTTYPSVIFEQTVLPRQALDWKSEN